MKRSAWSIKSSLPIDRLPIGSLRRVIRQTKGNYTIAMDSKERTAAWSSYWTEGNSTSLPNLYPNNYDGGVLEFWASTFRELEEHARLLDICTGNGAIALLAREHLDRRGIICDIHAIDSAEIHPPPIQGHGSVFNDVEFHAGTAVEETGFPDRHFDLIVGQFALEYCDLENAIKELSRIIRCDGRIAFMMHHEGSITVRKTNDLIGIADFFLEKPTIFYRLRKYAEQYSHEKNAQTPKIIQMRSQLSASLDRAGDLLRLYPTNRFLRATLAEIRNVAQRVHSGSPGQVREIRQFENVVRNYLIRMRDQREAALSSEDILMLVELLRQYGFLDISYQPFYSDRLLFAWTLMARKGSRVHDAEQQS